MHKILYFYVLVKCLIIGKSMLMREYYNNIRFLILIYSAV